VQSLLLTISLIINAGEVMPKITIQPGNTLFQIARGTGYTPEQLAAYNMIEDPNQIRVGQDIFIPYSRQEFESFAGPMTQPVQAATTVQPTATQPVVQTSQAQVVDTLSREEKALLDAISFAEGTTSSYGTLFGGTVLPELEKGNYTVGQVIDMSKSKMLPDGITKAGYGTYKGQESGATGKYQLMGFVLEEEAKKQGIDLNKKFTPELQDKIMIERIKRKRKIDTDDLSKTGLTQDILDKLAKEFASIPYSKKGFKSYYGQPNKQAIDIIKHYNQSLSR
jgi:muramidase (phage lysozyme)